MDNNLNKLEVNLLPKKIVNVYPSEAESQPNAISHPVEVEISKIRRYRRDGTLSSEKESIKMKGQSSDVKEAANKLSPHLPS